MRAIPPTIEPATIPWIADFDSLGGGLTRGRDMPIVELMQLKKPWSRLEGRGD